MNKFMHKFRYTHFIIIFVVASTTKKSHSILNKFHKSIFSLSLIPVLHYFSQYSYIFVEEKWSIGAYKFHMYRQKKNEIKNTSTHVDEEI